MRSTRRGPAVSGVSSFTYGAAELEPRAARALLREVTLVVLAAVGVEQGGCLIALGIRGPRGRLVVWLLFFGLIWVDWFTSYGRRRAKKETEAAARSFTLFPHRI